MANEPAPPAPPADPKETTSATTTFYLFTGTDDMKDWAFIGTETARDRDHAIRLRFPDPTEGHAGNIVAVSDAAWKPRNRVLETKPTAKLNAVSMPNAQQSIPLPAPPAEPAPKS